MRSSSSRCVDLSTWRSVVFWYLRTNLTRKAQSCKEKSYLASCKTLASQLRNQQTSLSWTRDRLAYALTRPKVAAFTTKNGSSGGVPRAALAHIPNTADHWHCSCARGRSRDTQTQQDTQPQRYATAATVPHRYGVAAAKLRRDHGHAPSEHSRVRTTPGGRRVGH